MELIANGIDYATGLPVNDTLDETLFAENILKSMRDNIDQIRQEDRNASAIRRLREEVQRRIVDKNDPDSVGWTFLVNEADPQHDDILKAIRPLAIHRGMNNPEAPLYFRGEQEEDWQEWLDYRSVSKVRVPQYVLIIGGPEQVPFHFQAILSVSTYVGRVCFDTVDDLERYIKKLIRLENADEPAVERKALIFAPENERMFGLRKDATYYSRRYMAKPLADFFQESLDFRVNYIGGPEATKARLESALRSPGTALVYTASHGLNAINSDYETQQRLNGAICCGDPFDVLLDQRIFTADDIPQDDPFLEGAVFFQFACFGYGTPAISDFSLWRVSQTRVLAEADFVAAIPKKLLANPRGPIAYIGHVDQAWLHGFADPKEPPTTERWDLRIKPFVTALSELSGVSTCGYAMEQFSERYNNSNAYLTNTFDRLRQNRLSYSPTVRRRVADKFIFRTDAQNYMVFGDPAAHLRFFK